ncbi:MAG: leucine--tRNA ligase, partial [Gemmatimonadota bacterium]
AVDTTRPDYYKWTQWVFLQLYKQGLAYRKSAAVNWCPSCKTVLANEQVESGNCERCGTEVTQRVLEQWFCRISEYAPRLLGNLDRLDWSETTKQAQRNWIGRSEGAHLLFPVTDPRTDAGAATVADVPDGEPDDDTITVFTTRPDTVFGATYLVLAPEHPLVDVITTPERRAAVEAYRVRTAQQDLVSRKVTKEKTGAFTGAYAINPATQRPIPVWIADYVLMEYGTGAIMAVPGHDERDFAFAQVFGLPIVRVVAGDGEDARTPLAEAFHGEGRLVNSARFDGLRVDEAKGRIVEWLASRKAARAVTNYRLHDWCISRQRYWGPPIPILYCDACGVVPVPEAQLPVVLPNIPDYRPDDSGVSPLARHEEWYHVPCPRCGAVARRETDVSDTFLDSAWYFLRYPSADRDDVPFDAARTRHWLPVTSYIGGNEHAVLHLLYARFVTMVLHDAGLVPFEEPFATFRAHGLIIREGAKMSKSKGNVITPDALIEQWGADTFRTYLMFLGAFEEGGDYRDSGIVGVRRFLDRVWASAAACTRDGAPDGAPDAGVLRKLHATIKKVGEDIPRLSYNTAIAAMMEYVNALRAGERIPHHDEVRPLVSLLAPFAPHLAEALHERLGGTGSVMDAGWPAFDPALLVEDEAEIVVQVAGKVRGKVRVPRHAGQDAVAAAALADPAIAKFVNGTPKKLVYVPGRLLNVVP